MTPYELGFLCAMRNIIVHKTWDHYNPYKTGYYDLNWRNWNRGYNKGRCLLRGRMSADEYKSCSCYFCMPEDPEDKEQLTFF